MKLTSYGAAEEVTGSCHLLEVGDRKILLDCGLIQGRRKDEARNRDAFPFDPSTLDAVILSHAHIDHSGRLPILVRQGFKGRIHTHAASADLCKTLLKDSAFLNERDTEYRNKRRARKGQKPLDPLYTQEDVKNTIRLFRKTDFNKKTRLFKEVEFTLHDAGHILGSAMVELDLKEGKETRKVVFSGDLGHRGAPILRDFTMLEDADLVMLESTYGNRLHRDWSETFDEVTDIVGTVKQGKGNVLIPAFAVGRSQMILYMFARYFKEWDIGRWQIFLDSPMAIEATKVYMKHVQLYDDEAAAFWREHGTSLSLPNLTFSRSAAASQKINKMQSGALVIAGSGMCTGGRIMHHLKHNLWRKNCHVIIAGYQSHGSLGRKLVEGEESVKVWGERIKVEASVHTVGGLSAHADQQGLMDWYGNFNGRPPALMVHGEPDSMQVLSDRIAKELQGSAHMAKAGKSTDLLQLDRLKK